MMLDERREAGGGRRVEEGQRYGDEAIKAVADPAQWEIWAAPEGHREVLYQRFPEFTCLCPRSGYPDFATVHLVTIPDRKVLELKHLKLWPNSFRERRISHEAAAAEIVDTLARTLDLFYAFILMAYTPRGNLITVPMIEFRRPGPSEVAETDQLALALANAARVRDRLIDQAVTNTSS